MPKKATAKKVAKKKPAAKKPARKKRKKVPDTYTVEWVDELPLGPTKRKKTRTKAKKG